MQIKFFKIKKSFKKGGLHTNPDVYWNVLQVVALLLVLASFIFSFYFFKRVNKEFTLSDDNTAGKGATLSKERIDKALEYFAEKNKKSITILNSPSPIIDPSR